MEDAYKEFEAEISSLTKLTHAFIPTQIRRTAAPTTSSSKGASGVVISGAPKVYSSNPTTTSSSSAQPNPKQHIPLSKSAATLSTPSTPALTPGNLQTGTQSVIGPAFIPSSALAAASSTSSSAPKGENSSAILSKPLASTSGTGEKITKKIKKKKSKKEKDQKPKKHLRSAGGQVWEDQSLLDWDPSGFRLFCGDLGNDVTDEVLTRVFGRYPSFQRAKVIRDKRTNKTKGFGFVSFKEPHDFVRAIKELDGRYVGSRPIKLRKSCWKTRNLDQARKREKERTQLMTMIKKGKTN